MFRGLRNVWLIIRCWESSKKFRPQFVSPFSVERFFPFRPLCDWKINWNGNQNRNINFTRVWGVGSRDTVAAKNENLESNNFYVFLKVFVVTFTFITSQGQKKSCKRVFRWSFCLAIPARKLPSVSALESRLAFCLITFPLFKLGTDSVTLCVHSWDEFFNPPNSVNTCLGDIRLQERVKSNGISWCDPKSLIIESRK